MLSQIVKNLQLASPVDVAKYTGIENWESESQSYTKSLYNNPLLPHDRDAFYCIDKLHLTFKQPKGVNRNELRSVFFGKKQEVIDKYLTIIPENKRPSYYYYSFSIVVEDVHFGRVKFCHNLNNEECLIEVDNEVLYCQKSGWIIGSIFHIAQKFNFTFNNISVIEFARDSNTNLPKEFSYIYHRSTHIHDVAHEVNGDHRYYTKVTKCFLGFLTDYKDSSECSFNVGLPTSNVYVKGYNKTKEIRDKKERKRYIQRIHDTHLDPSKDVYRLEITTHSGAYAKDGILGKKDVNLLTLLDKSNLPFLFFHLLGEKLEFKDLRTKKWVNRNKHFDRIKLLEPPPIFQYKEIASKPPAKKYSHDKNVNQTKQMINRYLDDRFGFLSLLDYCANCLVEDKDFALEFRSAFNSVLKNYKNKIQPRDYTRLEKLCSVLRKGMKWNLSVRVRFFISMLL